MRLRSLAGPLAAAALLLCEAASAERLPWQRFTGASGLAGDAVRDLFLDSRGFLWIATSSGISRFDGREFRNYDTSEGLPSPRVERLAETADGSIWAATGEGLARLDPEPLDRRHPFRREPLLPPKARGAGPLVADPDGSLWVGHEGGITRIEIDTRGRATAELIELPGRHTYDRDVVDMTRAADGTFWIGTGRGLLRRAPDGRTERLIFPTGDQSVGSLMVDREGRVWFASGAYVYILVPAAMGDVEEREVGDVPDATRLESLPRRPGEIARIDETAGLPPASTTTIVDGRSSIWIANRKGLFELGPNGPRWLGVANGLPEGHVSAAVEDGEGNLWLGSESRGLARLLPSGFHTYDVEDGLANDRISSIFESPPGELYVTTQSRELHRFRDGRFVEITPRTIWEGAISGWGWNEYIHLDRRGRLWYPTGTGLFRFAKPASPAAFPSTRPDRVWRADELGGTDVFRLYEDRSGDIWASVFVDPPLLRFRGGGEKIEKQSELQAMHRGGAPSAFAEDREGGLWVGFYGGGLGLLRDGRWSVWEANAGTPPGLVSDLFVDQKGRLWITTHAAGAAVVEDPLASPVAPPQFHRFGTAQGLSTDSIRCVTEDRAGRIYLGTSRGVDRLDPETGSVRVFSSDDGLSNDLVRNCFTSSDGDLWFGTLHGLARYRPPESEPRAVPRIWISGLRVAGRPRTVPDRGVAAIEGLSLAPSDRAMEIEFLGLGLSLGRNLFFQHRVNEGEWSEPARERRLQLASLAPGDYRVEIRATTRDGLAAIAPAVVAFSLPPPVYRRPWFVALVVAAGLAAYGAALRVRARRLLAVERTRTRIASDLHDDVGSSVSRIGLLGELARQRLRGEPAAAEDYLEEIGSEARELADATSDIVWAVDPRRDDLGSLVVRLRRFAEDLMEAKEIDLDFEAPPAAGEIRLDPEVRRSLHLALKEAIHNVAKHSGARRASVEIRATAREIEAVVTDDGRGIAPGRAEEAAREGRHGLPGLATRASEVGGRAVVEPAPGGGTRVRLHFPRRTRREAGPHGASHSDARRGRRGG